MSTGKVSGRQPHTREQAIHMGETVLVLVTMQRMPQGTGSASQGLAIAMCDALALSELIATRYVFS